MDREREIKEETRRPEPEDLGMPAAKENRILMALFPGEGRTYRGGIQELTEVYVSPTSDAYTGANGSQTITFIITSTDTEMIIPSLCHFETQVAVQVSAYADPVGAAALRAINTEDRVLLRNFASSCQWRSCDVQLNSISVSDQCHLDQTGVSPAIASYFHTHQTHDTPYGSSSWSRAVVPGVRLSSAAVQAATAIGVDDMAANATSSLVGACGGDTAPLEGVSFAQPPILGTVANACLSMGENGSRPQAGGAWSRHYPLVASSAANPTTLIYQPCTTIFQSPTPLLPGSKLTVTLTKNDPSMWFQCAAIAAQTANEVAAVSVNYIRCRFWVTKISLIPSLQAAVREYALSKPYTYDAIVRRVQSFTIPVGAESFSVGGVLQGPQISRGYVFLSRGCAVDTAATNYRTSPWAMSPSSLLEGNDVGIGNTTSLAIPLVTNAWIRVGSRQYPLIFSYQASGAATVPQVDNWRAYKAFIRSCGRALKGGPSPLISIYQFCGDYLVYTFDLNNDPWDPIATTIGDAASATASTTGLELFLQFSGAVIGPTAAGGAPALRAVVVGESPGTISLSAAGGVSKLGM